MLFDRSDTVFDKTGLVRMILHGCVPDGVSLMDLGRISDFDSFRSRYARLAKLHIRTHVFYK